MGLGSFFIVLTVLCTLNCFDARKQLTYNYTGSVIASNKISDDGYAKFLLFGDLTVQHFKDHHIFKLDNLKTLLFNGLKTAKEPEKKEPLANTEYITKPFAVYYNSIDDVEITVDLKEPIWSKNMKKAIASIFHVDTTVEDGFHGFEQTIYGNCSVKYDIYKQTDIKFKYFSKKIDLYSCADFPKSEWENVNKVDLTKHKSTLYETKRFYSLHKKSGDIDYIQSSSNLTYQNTPAMRATHELEQEQTFKLTNSVTEFEPLEIPTNVIKMDSLLWEIEDEEESEGNKTQTEMINDYKKALEDFKDKFHKRPLENTKISDADLIDDMYTALSNLDTGGIALLTLDHMFNDVPEDQHILISLLPYVGSEHTTELIKEFVKNDDINDLLLIKLLTIFPSYINIPGQQMLNKFKFLMNLEQIVTNNQVRYAGILSYAALVTNAFERTDINQKFMLETFHYYQSRLTNSEKYEEQLVYLLGLVNLAICMEEDLILQIITDPGLDDKLRPLALFSFKNYVTNTNEEDVFKQIWPFVQNASQPFDVRVASLDLLLSSKLTEEQFNTILDTYDKKPANPYDEHLGNYLFTTIQSSNYSLDYIANFAKARLEKGSIPRYTRSWTTGNYRLGFYDDQTLFGVSLATSLIGTPVTNALNVIYLSFNRFEMSMDVDSYTVYLKLGGVIDTVFLNAFLDSRTDADTPISALLDLIKKFNYKIKGGEDIHIDIALFSKKKAVFGIHINQDNIETYSDNPLFLDLMKLLVYYQSVSFPIVTYTKIPSDLGTTIIVAEDIQQVVLQEFDNFEQIADDDLEVKEMTYRYKSHYISQTTLACQNPLVKASVVVRRQNSDEKAIYFPFKFNTTSYSLSWKVQTQNNTFNMVSDHNIGTSIDEEDVLKHYCPDCDEYYEVPIGDYFEKSHTLQKLGFTFEMKKTNASVKEEYLDLVSPRPDATSVMDVSYHSNGFVFPPAKPIMFLWNYFYYINYINELESFSFRTNPAYDEEYESVFEFDVTENSITTNNDPLDGEELEAYLSLKQQKPDGHILSGFNTTFKLIKNIKSSDEQSKPQVEHNYALYANIYDDEDNYTRICINREMLYPSKRSDKLSLKPVKPAKGKLTIAVGSVESLSEFPKEYIKFTELYTATEIQNRKAKEMEEYKKCKEDSAGFKYVPPTPDCAVAHKALSKYDFYGIYAHFEHASRFKHLQEYLDQTKLGYKIMEYNHIEDGLLNVSFAEEIRARYLSIPDSNYIENSVFFDFLSVDPTAVAYDDYDIYAGIAKTCIITPNTIETFTGIREAVFEENDHEEIVAYIECSNKTRAGLTVQRVNNKAVGFKQWSGDNLLAVTSDREKLKVTLNGEQITQTPETQDEDIKIYFLEQDVIYVVDSIVEVYYTTEYISIKALSLYDKYTCGRCSYKEKI